MTEYVIAIGVLLPIFLLAAIYLKEAGLNRGDYSMNTGATTLPCEADLSEEECK